MNFLLKDERKARWTTLFRVWNKLDRQQESLEVFLDTVYCQRWLCNMPLFIMYKLQTLTELSKIVTYTKWHVWSWMFVFVRCIIWETFVFLQIAVTSLGFHMWLVYTGNCWHHWWCHCMLINKIYQKDDSSFNRNSRNWINDTVL